LRSHCYQIRYHFLDEASTDYSPLSLIAYSTQWLFTHPCIFSWLLAHQIRTIPLCLKYKAWSIKSLLNEWALLINFCVLKKAIIFHVIILTYLFEYIDYRKIVLSLSKD
jgi:hypothetical protein